MKKGLKIDSIICKYKLFKKKMYKIKPKYECKYCGGSKRSKSEYENHIYLCKYIQTSVLPSKYDSQENQKILLNHLIDLKTKYENMEKRVKELENLSSTIMKKNVANHLKEYVPDLPFQCWLEKCQIDECDLNQLFDPDVNDAYEILENIMQKYLKNDDNKKMKLPLYVCKKKQNVLYIYDRPCMDSQIFEWQLAKSCIIKKIMTHLTNKLQKKYSEWCSENMQVDNNHVNTEIEETLVGCMHKINGIRKTIGQKNGLFKKKMTETIIFSQQHS